MKFGGIKKTLHQVNKIRYRPALLAKIAKAYFHTLVLRRPTLRVIEFSITPECQSNCEFCYASKFHKAGKSFLTPDEIRSTWEQAKAMGAFSSIVFGGEPLLHPQFFDIIDVLEPKNNIVTITTNAIDLTEDRILKLKDAGVFLINISLNSLDPELNDRLRGYKGHFDKVMSAIALCKKHDVDVFLPVATSKPYLNETIEIIDFAKRMDLGVTVNLMCAMGRGEGRHEDQFDEEFWKELRKLYDANPGLRSDFDVNLDLEIGCPAGYEKIHICPYGDATGCSMNPVGFGNVREEPLEIIVGRMRNFHHYSKYHPSCLVAVDSEYIGDYMDFASNYESTPYHVNLNPKYKNHCNSGYRKGYRRGR